MVRIDGTQIIATFLLRLEDSQRLRIIGGRNDAITDCSLQQLRGAQVYRVGERSEVPKGAERVRIARTHIRQSL